MRLIPFKRKPSKKAVYILLPVLLFVLGCTGTKNDRLTIAAAANMQFVMEELSQTFANETGIEYDIILGSSGKLTAQIKEGAPYDVFVSANMKYPYDLHKDGFTVAEPKIYAYGKLVLWTMDTIAPSLNGLTHEKVQHIALANPKTAPYGQAAISVLKDISIYDSVKNKLVFGESISQTNQFIVSGAAEIGFTAKSVVLSPTMAKKGSWVAINENHYEPIAQGMVILDKEDTAELAKKFSFFMFSDTAKEILEHYGYAIAIK